MTDAQKAALKWLLNRKRLKATDAGRISMNEFATSRDVKFSVDDSLPRRAAE